MTWRIVQTRFDNLRAPVDGCASGQKVATELSPLTGSS